MINIYPPEQPEEFANENDLLPAHRSANTDEMLQRLERTNNDIADIASAIKHTIHQMNNNNELLSIVNDKSIPKHIKGAVANMYEASNDLNSMSTDLNSMIRNIKKGEGSLGSLMTDTAYAYKMAQVLDKMQTVSDDADSLVSTIERAVDEINFEVQHGNGPINSLLQDSMVFLEVHSSLQNIREGTESFNQNMEALKHNFLFRGYFKKQSKKNKRTEEKLTKSE